MLFANQKNPEPAQFWQDLQEELGEEVVLYTLGELKELSQEPRENEVPHERHRGRPGAVGLCYLTDKAFYFHTFPEKSWFTTLVTSKKNRKEEFRLRILRTEILQMELIKPKGLCERLFSSPLERLRIRYSADPPGQIPGASFVDTMDQSLDESYTHPSHGSTESHEDDTVSVLSVALHGKGKEFIHCLRVG